MDSCCNYLNLGPNDNNSLFQIDKFRFKNVEEEPLLGTFHASFLAVVALSTLVIGLGVSFRIHKMLKQRKSIGGSVAIDKLFFTHNIISMLGHMPLLVNYISYLLYLRLLEKNYQTILWRVQIICIKKKEQISTECSLQKYLDDYYDGLYLSEL